MDAVAGRSQPWLNRVFGEKPGIFFVCLYAWTLTNLDQSLFGYAIPGILAEFRLPLEAAGTILTISFVFAALLIVCAGLAADRYRGVAMGLLQCGYPLGWLLASLLAAPLLAKYDWRAACYVAFIVVPLAIPIGLYLARVGDGAGAISVTDPRTGQGRIRQLFGAEYRGRSLASMLLFFAFGGAYAGSATSMPRPRPPVSRPPSVSSRIPVSAG